MIITIASQKGGVGKTTTAGALVGELMKQGYKVLAIDLDSQCNLSYQLQADTSLAGAAELLMDMYGLPDVIHASASGVDIVQARYELSTVETEINKKPFSTLHDILKRNNETLAKYDYVIIDTPPALTSLTINAIGAADHVIIPITADAYAIRGLKPIYEAITKIKETIRPELNLAGLLVTRYSGRTNLEKALFTQLQQACTMMNTKLFDTVIHEGVAVRESQATGQLLTQATTASRPAQDYISFSLELLKRMKRG